MRKRSSWLCSLAFAAFSLVACSGDNTYTSHPCYLVIDNGLHLDETLASAMNQMSPGVFCMITNNDARKEFTFLNNSGLSSTKRYNAEDDRRTRALGMNGGLIVGFGTLTDGQFCAYDRECPNCFDPAVVPVRSKPLTMSGDGIAACNVCRRRYNMNNGGNSESDGKGLTRYRCSTTGSYGVLHVGN
ncbi:hypothetical protein [Palleniella muris]|uniref:hypothetical protein n=1 Tax=Palleniella muris TaxID=3038145 RepID=UPI00240FF857|nr:hypothetical protein [Palleniella muris]